MEGPQRIAVLDGYARNVAFRAPLLAALAERGHQVTACVPDAPEWVLDALRSMRVAHVPVSLRREGRNPISELCAFVGLVRLLHRIRPDILINFTIKPVLYGTLAAALAGVPRCFSVITGVGHLFIDRSLRTRILRSLIWPLYRLALRRNAAVFFQNPDDLREFREERLLGQHVRVALINGSGVDIERFPYVPPRNDGSVFLYLGRLLAEKGVREFVEAARILRKRHPEARFQLLGPFDSNPSSLKPDEVDRWHRAGEIEYLGETIDVRPYLAGCSVLVMPSYREGTPRSVLEAMATGRPVVTTDVPGCRETVVDSENGFLVPARDPQRLAEAMELFIVRPDLVESMGRSSREIAVRKYDARQVNAVVLGVLGLDSPAAVPPRDRTDPA